MSLLDLVKREGNADFGKRDPYDYNLSGFNYGAGKNASAQRAQQAQAIGLKRPRPLLSVYSGSLSAGSNAIHPSLMTKPQMQKLAKAWGFGSVTSAGMALLANAVDHNMIEIQNAVQALKSENPSKNRLGGDLGQLRRLNQLLLENSVTNAGKDLPLDSVYKRLKTEGKNWRTPPERSLEKQKEMNAILFEARGMPGSLKKIRSIMKSMMKVTGNGSVKNDTKENRQALLDNFAGYTIEFLVSNHVITPKEAKDLVALHGSAGQVMVVLKTLLGAALNPSWAAGKQMPIHMANFLAFAGPFLSASDLTYVLGATQGETMIKTALQNSRNKRFVSKAIKSIQRNPDYFLQKAIASQIAYAGRGNEQTTFNNIRSHFPYIPPKTVDGRAAVQLRIEEAQRKAEASAQKYGYLGGAQVDMGEADAQPD